MAQYSESRWRNMVQPIIAEVLNRGLPLKEQRAALRESYPFGERRYHPYKIWLDEVARQTGRKPKLGSRMNVHGKAVMPPEPNPNQGDLF